MHEINFVVPLSGSKLFDTHIYAVAKNLCNKFPGLEFDYTNSKQIQIYGELSDYWFQKWNEAVFQIGEIG